jgi:peptide/nickel transport system ATP-binding protein
VELPADCYNKYPHEFSGGQRQRIVIARALIMQPKFVICDESVSALDVSVQAQVLNLLNDLKASMQFSALFITHDLSVVKYISDRIMVMNKGKLEEIGPANTVYNSPKSLYTQELIAALP